MNPNDNQGLADAQEGEFILNESGTSISIDDVDAENKPVETNSQGVQQDAAKTETQDSKQ